MRVKTSEELQKLYNTLLTVETKGDSTLVMADCLKFVSQLILKCKEEEKSMMVTNNDAQ